MNALRIAALTGFLAVALGAFGAHGLREILERNGTVAIWHTAVVYHLAHAVVLLVLAARPGAWYSGAFGWFAAGVAVFSGSLYLLAVTHAQWLGAVTPLGGVFLLVGWAWLGIRGFGTEGAKE